MDASQLINGKLYSYSIDYVKKSIQIKDPQCAAFLKEDGKHHVYFPEGLTDLQKQTLKNDMAILLNRIFTGSN